MKKPVYLLFLGLLIFLFSCQKEEIDPILPDSVSLKDIKVSSTFNWSTSKTVNVNITGLPTGSPVVSTLVLSLENGNTLFQQSYVMSESKVIQIIIPANEDQIKIRFGNMDYLLPVEGDKVDFSLIPAVQD
jgi:hypothetical protein